MMIGRGNQSTRRKPAPEPLYPPQIPHDLTGREPGLPRWEASDYPTELWHGHIFQSKQYAFTEIISLCRKFILELFHFQSEQKISATISISGGISRTFLHELLTDMSN
jgi:hypothetical protein